MKLGAAVLCYTLIALIVHILFILFAFTRRPIECISAAHKVSRFEQSFEVFIVWSILYFAVLLFCALYTLLFRMSRSFICSCWQCCGNDVNGKGATKCKICFEGVFGNPLIFAIIFIIWGIWEFAAFDETCAAELHYGFLADLVIVSLSLLLLCIYYFVRVKRRFEEKRNQRIAKKYNEQHVPHENELHNDEYHEGGDLHVPNLDRVEMAEGAGVVLQVRAPPQRRYSAQPMQRGKHALVARPEYAASAQEARRHSYNPQPSRLQAQSPNIAPAYAASAQGIAPYRPSPQQSQAAMRRHSLNAQPNGNVISHSKQESVSISIDLESPHDEDDVIPAATRTRGPSVSFPSHFKGHARKVSSRILNILQRIEPEPECSICMCELEKGDEMGQLECGHAFHKQCIVEWLGNEPSCPMCRVDMQR